MKIIGIDLGEEKCCVAVFGGKWVQIVANDEGCRTTPAYVSFCENGRFIGASAKEEKSMNPENTIYNIRRILGRNFSDPVVQQEVNDVPFTITNENNKPMILVSYEGGMKKKKFLPEQISGMILKELKENAEVYLREPITDAVITVPAYFNDAQRAATRDAARIAELNVSSIICEATAAAIAYGLESEGKRNVLVFYLERSRLEVTVLTIDEDILTVKATICDTQLGGEVLINNLVQHCIREFKGKHEKNISSSKPAFNRLYVACESVLKKLSYFTRASIQIDGLVDGIDFRTTILRAKFEDLNADLLKLTINAVEKVITDSNIVDDEIDDIVLVGEFTRVPKIREILMDQFPGKEIRRKINPNEVLAYGTASYGYRIASGINALREVFQDKNEFHTKADQQNNLTQDSTNIEIKEAIGIDLGTTLSGVSVYRNGKFEMVPNEMGNFLTPSCVAFTEIERLIGEVAKEEMALNSENTLVQIKRLIGRKFDDKSVKYDIKNLGFEIINEGNKPVIQVKHKKKLVTFHPEQISGMLLRNLKETADAFMGTNFTHAVITVPAYFDDAQRAATKNAGMIAGLNVLSVLNEPTAAAIAYGLEREDQRSRNVLIYDLGGGTFDVTVVTIKGRVFDVRATSGDSHLGGEDFDRRMVDHIVEEFNKKNKTDVRQDKRAICKLRTQCEIAKKRLSVCNEARVQVDALYNSIDFREKITRAKFEDLNLDYFMKSISTVENTLTEAKLTKDEIDDVVLVGGSSRIPKIRELLIAFFNGKKLCSTVNPDEVVARGAAAFAATFCQDTSVKIKDFVLEDILPFTLGVGCEGGVMAVVAKKGSKIPSQHYHVFTTNVKNPTALGFSIYQGEHSSTKYNRLLGSFSLTGIVPPTQGASQIDVCFDIDLSGILTATAKDRVTGKESNIRLDSDTGGLSSEKLKEMRCEEERFGIEDKSHKDILQLRNKLQDLVFSIEQTFQDLEVKGKIPTGEKLSMLEKCEEVLEWLEKTDNASKEEITEKHLQFEKMGHPYSSRSYQK